MKKPLIPQPAFFKRQPVVLPSVFSPSGLAQAKSKAPPPVEFIPKSMPSPPVTYQPPKARNTTRLKSAPLGSAPQISQTKPVSARNIMANGMTTPPVPAVYRPTVTLQALQAKLVGTGPARIPPQNPPVYRAGAAPQQFRGIPSTFVVDSSLRLPLPVSLIQRAAITIKPTKKSQKDLWEESQARKKAELQEKIAKEREEKAEEKREQARIAAIPDFDSEAALLVVSLFEKSKLKFRERCQRAGLDPSQIAQFIATTATDKTSSSLGLIAFAESDISLKGAIYLASNYQRLAGLRMKSENLSTSILKAWQAGVIDVEVSHYRDTTLHSGVVFIFHLEGTDKRITPEWHVHWGTGKTVSAASFKDQRMSGDRVTTNAADHEALRKIEPIGDSWGG